MAKTFFLVFSVLFVFIFIFHYFFITKPALKRMYLKEEKVKKGKQKNQKKAPEVVEITYLVNKFKIDKDKLNWKSLAIMIPLINSFIMALVVAILELIPLKLIWNMLIAFILLFSLIYSLYEIYGRFLKSKQERNKD